MLMISPSCKARSSGIPWHTTLFTDVHTDFGNVLYNSGDGYALFLTHKSCTIPSISSVVVPSVAYFPASVKICCAREQASLMPRICCGVFISGSRDLNQDFIPQSLSKYGGFGTWFGTSLSGVTFPGSTVRLVWAVLIGKQELLEFVGVLTQWYVGKWLVPTRSRIQVYYIEIILLVC